MHLLMADGKQWESAGPTVCMWRADGLVRVSGGTQTVFTLRVRLTSELNLVGVNARLCKSLQL